MTEFLRFANEDKNLETKLRDTTNNKGIIYNTLSTIQTMKKRIGFTVSDTSTIPLRKLLEVFHTYYIDVSINLNCIES